MQITDSLVVDAIKIAREHVKNHDELVPMWWVGGANGIDLVATPFEGPDEHGTKDAVARTIKQMAAAKDADFILFISECWTLQGDEEASKEYMANRGRYPNGLADHPKRKECVMVDLQTHDGTKIGMAPILPGRVMGDISWPDDYTRIAGRFANLLPPRGPRRDNNNQQRS